MIQAIPMHVLSAYLPYGVKVKHLTHKWGRVYEEIAYIECISVENVGFSGACMDWYFDSNENECEFKLLLRPLSDLSKPLPELEGKTALESVIDLLNGLGYSWPKAKVQSNENYDEHGIFIAIAHDSTLSFRLSPDYYMLPMEAIIKVRELLLSLHFDLFNAIQQGWGLDLNQETL